MVEEIFVLISDLTDVYTFVTIARERTLAFPYGNHTKEYSEPTKQKSRPQLNQEIFELEQQCSMQIGLSASSRQVQESNM